MMIVHPVFSSPIDMNENEALVFVIENNAFFREFIDDISSQISGEDGHTVISENYSPIDMKSVFLISDYFNIDLNDRTTAGRINSNLIDISENEIFDKTNQFKEYAFNYFSDLISRADFDLSFDDLNFSAILKCLKIHINESDLFLEKIIDVIKIHSLIFGAKLIVFVNLKTFLSPSELGEVYKFCGYNKISVMLIENTQRERLENEKVVIIDDDLCEIY